MSEWHRRTGMTEPDSTVVCNFLDIHKHTHTHTHTVPFVAFDQRFS